MQFREVQVPPGIAGGETAPKGTALRNQGVHLVHQRLTAGGGHIVDEQHILNLIVLAEIHNALLVIPVINDVNVLIVGDQERSEERRVGKECRL